MLAPGGTGEEQQAVDGKKRERARFGDRGGRYNEVVEPHRIGANGIRKGDCQCVDQVIGLEIRKRRKIAKSIGNRSLQGKYIFVFQTSCYFLWDRSQAGIEVDRSEGER